MTTIKGDPTRAYGEPKPMLCKAVLSEKECTIDKRKGTVIPHIIEPKLDGYRMMVRKGEDGSMVAWTRGGKYIHEKVPHIMKELSDIMPTNTIFDGELLSWKLDYDTNIYEADFPYVQSVVNSLPARAQALQSDFKPLIYSVFDCLWLIPKKMASGEESWEEADWSYNVPFVERRHHLQTILGTYLVREVKGTWGQVVPIWYWDTSQGGEYDFEGTVIKWESALYLPGKRTRGWYKLKKTFDVDVVLMDYKPGIGKFSGTLGAAIFGQYDESGVLVERGACSGFDDDQRDHLFKNWDKYVGTVITVQHMGLMAGKVKFRHPQFLKFREDKTADECIWHNY